MIIVGMNGDKKEVPVDSALPKSISEAVSKSLSEIETPQSGPINPFRPDPFREPINKLDQAWRQEDPELVAKRPQKINPVPPILPGETAVQPIVQPVTQAAAVQPMAQAPKPIFTEPPVTKPIVIEPEPVQQAPVAPPVAKNNSILKNIRTYESDVADLLEHRNTSRASMAIAENVRSGEGNMLGNAEEHGSGIGKKLLLVIISLVIIGLGMAGGYYLYAKSPLGATAPVTNKPKQPPALVPYETQAVISTDGISTADILSQIRIEAGKNQAAGSIKEIVPTQVKEGVTYRVSAIDMVYMMNIPMPDIILRTLNPEWMLGVYASPDGISRSAFVVATTNLFQNAFAGMLAWEDGMPEDLKAFITPVSSTGAIRAPQGEFRDFIVRNKDVRAFVTDNERTALVYSFIDNSTLVIAENLEALGSILNRLENKAFIR